MPEEPSFEFERPTERAEIASSLRTVVDPLEAGEGLVLEATDRNVALSPPGRPTFEIEAERETPSSSTDGPGELGIEFELEWTEGGGEDGANADGSLGRATEIPVSRAISSSFRELFPPAS